MYVKYRRNICFYIRSNEMKRKLSLRKAGILCLLLALCLTMLPISALADSFQAVVTSTSMVVRSGPTVDDSRIGTLKKGTTVTVLSHKNGIAFIEYKGKRGYARVSDMTRLSTETTTEEKSLSGLGKVTASSLTVYASADKSSKTLGTLKKGATITVLATKGDWARVENGSRTGYVLKSGLSIDTKATATATPAPTKKPSATPYVEWADTKESEDAVVTADKMIVRDGPTKDDEKLGTLKKGTKFIVHAMDDEEEVAYIEYKDQLGFALVEDFRLVNPKATSSAEKTSGLGVVNVKTLSVYEKASDSSKKLGTLKKGDRVTVLSATSSWANIQVGSKTGYVNRHMLNITFGVTATPTVKPTATAAPTPTATPAPESLSGIGSVTVDVLYVYKTASTSATKLGSLKKGDCVTVLAVKDGWARVQKGSNVGYVNKRGLDITYGATATPTVKPTATATATPAATKQTSATLAPGWEMGTAQSATVSKRAVVRIGPSASDTSLGYLSAGTKITVHAVKNGIAYIEYKGRTGYASASALKLDASSESEETALNCLCTLNADGTKVYASASTDSKVLATLHRGITFTALSEKDGWVKLENGKNIGYVKKSAVTLYPSVSPTAKPDDPIVSCDPVAAVIAEDSTKVYAKNDKSSKVLATLKSGTSVTLCGSSGSWAMIKSGDSTGYVYDPLSVLTQASVTLKESTSVTATVSKKTSVYPFMLKSERTVGTVTVGLEVKVLATKDNWALIQRGSNKGYCPLSCLTLAQQPTLSETTKQEAILSADAKLYQYASTGSTVKATLSKYTLITLLGYDDGWCLISSGSQKGYVPRGSVHLMSEFTLTATESLEATVSKASTVYAYAHTKSKSLGSLKKGATVTVLARDDKWALVQKGSNQGYMPLDALNVKTDEFTSPTVKTLTATVIHSGAKVYKLALEDADVMTTLALAADVKVTAYTSKWARVNLDGSVGYVLRKYLSNDDYSPLKSGDSSSSSVLKLQKALEDLGYFDGIPAGNYGTITKTAVERLQKELGVEVTGNADTALLRVLYGGYAPVSPIRSTALSKGDTGASVTRLQTRLTQKGYLSASIDGEYGSITEKAVKLYQSVAKLTETGKADKETLASLFSSSAPKNTGSAVTGTTSSSGTGNSSHSTDPSADPMSGTASEKIEKVIEIAKQQLGKTYVYATAGPNTFDCSGFTKYCYAKVGVSLRRSAQAVGYNDGTKIEGISNLKRGDIVCFNTIADNDLSDHVGIYLGSGKFIHASSGQGKVVISSLSNSYYNRVFSWGRRVL